MKPHVSADASNNRLVVFGCPTDNETHDCDAMGCYSAGPHVLEYINATVAAQELYRLRDRVAELEARPAAQEFKLYEIELAVLAELAEARKNYPTWPTDPLHAHAVLGEECGELLKAILQTTYEPHKANRSHVRKEALQTAAMALRFLESLDLYVYSQCEQHQQHPPRDK